MSACNFYSACVCSCACTFVCVFVAFAKIHKTSIMSMLYKKRKKNVNYKQNILAVRQMYITQCEVYKDTLGVKHHNQYTE